MSINAVFNLKYLMCACENQCYIEVNDTWFVGISIFINSVLV